MIYIFGFFIFDKTERQTRLEGTVTKAMRYKLSLGCFGFETFCHFFNLKLRMKLMGNNTAVITKVFQN